VKPSVRQNKKSILFLYEGYTEEEFYDRIFKLKLPPRSIRFTKKNLKGQFNINSKVIGKIKHHLDNKKDEKLIDVIIAYDREGGKSTPPVLNTKMLKSEFENEKRIKNISAIIATRDLESWFFHDFEGIANFLKIPSKKRNPDKYRIVERHSNHDLSILFKNYGKIYYKRGKKVEGFLDSLDLEKIYQRSTELKEGIMLIKNLIEKA